MTLIVSGKGEFKPDIAYREVPHCAMCQHWVQRPGEWRISDPAGYCWLLRRLVSADFGCVRWESKVDA